MYIASYFQEMLCSSYQNTMSRKCELRKRTRMVIATDISTQNAIPSNQFSKTEPFTALRCGKS